jgi:TolB-like protein/AraC-like DNA-binding protein/Tfp pilus assembly protein PilF
MPSTGDQLFIKRLTEVILANIAHEDFSVEHIAEAVGMSRSSIHRRLKEIRNQNASQFIREIRLQEAMEMLKQDLGNASEIAYKVGFGSPAYFTKCFHEYYGYPPGEVRKRSYNNRSDTISGEDKEIQETGVSGSNFMPGGNARRQGRKKIILITGIFAATMILLVLIIFSHDPLSFTSGKQSIIVLPFKNLTDDTGNQYFADGLMEDILNNLYQISDLRVVSRTTSEHFRDTDLTSGQIARKLNVRNVLEASIRREDDRIRVSVQLIDARHDQHIWSENYDRSVTTVLGVQREIALKIADCLKAVIDDNEANKIKEEPTQNPEAYDNYLRARFLLHKANSDQRFDISREGLLASLQYYEKAIMADSSFAEAYAGLANAWYNLSAWGWYKPYIEGIKNARKYCSAALEIDPDCAEAHAVNGVIFILPDRKYEEADKELQIAIQLDPYFSTARQWYAQLHMVTGPIEESRKQVDRAVELEPYFWVVQNLNSWIYYFEEKYEKGLEACRIASELNPGSPDNIWLFILHNARLQNADQAALELQVLFRYFPGGETYADEVTDISSREGVKGIFRWLAEVNKNRPLPVEGLSGNPFYVSWWYAIAGDREQAIVWLERSGQAERIPRHYFDLIAMNPDFDILRGDPRFTAIIEKEGLSAYNKRPPR